MEVEIIRCSNTDLSAKLADLEAKARDVVSITPSDVGGDGKVVQYLIIIDTSGIVGAGAEQRRS